MSERVSCAYVKITNICKEALWCVLLINSASVENACCCKHHSAWYTLIQFSSVQPKNPSMRLWLFSSAACGALTVTFFHCSLGFGWSVCVSTEVLLLVYVHWEFNSMGWMNSLKIVPADSAVYLHRLFALFCRCLKFTCNYPKSGNEGKVLINLVCLQRVII